MRLSQTEVVYLALAPPKGISEAELRLFLKGHGLDDVELEQVVRVWRQDVSENFNLFAKCCK